MLKFIKAFEKSLFSLTKIFLIFVLYLIFYSVYAIDSPELQRFSRVSTIITTTFLILCYIMLRLYGNFSIGEKRTRELVISVALGAAFTNLFTYGQLCIMEKKIEPFYPLALIFAVQVLSIIIIAKGANKLYSALNPPLKMIVICSGRADFSELSNKLKQYKHRYSLVKSAAFSSGRWKQDIDTADGALIADIDSNSKRAVMEYCYKKEKKVLFEPDFSDIIINSSTHELLDDTSLFVNSPLGLTFEQRLAKRIFDLIFSAILIVVLSPAMLIVAFAVKLSDGGRIFYRQQRSTIGGKFFYVIKFRTMVENAEDKTGAVLAQINDSRITKTGRILRKLRLDELPQLFNVLGGSMSIVGPRPEREELAKDICTELPEFEYRLRVKAGLTGLAQISGKYSTAPKEKLFLDILYIERYSLKLDLKIILQTLLVIFAPEKAE